MEEKRNEEISIIEPIDLNLFFSPLPFDRTSPFFELFSALRSFKDNCDHYIIHNLIERVLKPIENDNLINKIAFQDNHSLETFASLIIKGMPNLLSYASEAAMLEICQSTIRHSVKEFESSIIISILCNKISLKVEMPQNYSKNRKGVLIVNGPFANFGSSLLELAYYANEALSSIKNCAKHILCAFLIKYFSAAASNLDAINSIIVVSPKGKHNKEGLIKTFTEATNRLLAFIIVEKPSVLMYKDLSAVLQAFLNSPDLSSPSPQYILDNPSNCTLSSSITSSIIMGYIAASFHSKESIDEKIQDIFLVAPYQTQFCLSLYIKKFDSGYLQKLERYPNIAKALCYESVDQDLIHYPFFENLLPKKVKKFFRSPNQESMNKLISSKQDLSAVVGICLQDTDLRFGSAAVDALDEKIKSISGKMIELDCLTLYTDVNDILNLLQGIVRDIGVTDDVIEAIVDIADILLLYHSNKSTFLTERIEIAIGTLKEICLQVPYEFFGFVSSHVEHLSSMYFMNELAKAEHGSLFEGRLIAITNCLSFHMRQPYWITLRLSTRMLISVAEAICTEEAARLAYISIRFFIKAMNESNLTSECFFLRALRKVLRLPIFVTTFVTFEELCLPLVKVCSICNETAVLVFDIFKEIFEPKPINQYVQAMFFLPSDIIILPILREAHKQIESDIYALSRCAIELITSVFECPHCGLEVDLIRSPLTDEREIFPVERDCSISELRSFTSIIGNSVKRVIVAIRALNISKTSNLDLVKSIVASM